MTLRVLNTEITISRRYVRRRNRRTPRFQRVTAVTGICFAAALAKVLAMVCQ